MTWLYIYAGIGAVFSVLAMVGGSLDEPWHVRACVYVGLVALWPLVNAAEIAEQIQQKLWERKHRCEMEDE